MINLDSIINENSKAHNKKWPFIPDHPYRMIIIGPSGSGKRKAFNPFHNILRHFDVLPNFALTTSETMGDYYI